MSQERGLVKKNQNLPTCRCDWKKRLGMGRLGGVVVGGKVEGRKPMQCEVGVQTKKRRK